MKINGNLQFRALGKGELQNAIIERLDVAPTGEPGRIYFNTTDNLYYYYRGGSPASWIAFATSPELDATQLSMGYVHDDGTFNAAAFNGFINIGGSPLTDLVTALAQLDTSLGPITNAGRALIDDASHAAMRTTLDVYSTGEADSAFVDITGDTMTGDLIMMSGTSITIPDIPQDDTDAVNKAYADQIAANIHWRDPIQDPDLVDIVTAEPTIHNTVEVGDTTTYIKWGGVQEENWAGAINKVVDGDILTFEVQANSGSPITGEWRRIGNLRVGDRFIIAAEHGDIHEALEAMGFVIHDLIQYLGGGGSPPTEDNPYSADAWDRPEGIAECHGCSPSLLVGSPSPEIPAGTTVLVSNTLSFHANHSYSYNQAPDHSWVEIAGPGAVGAGAGLSYSGTELRVNFGAGIEELPEDGVGISLYDTTTGALILTEDPTGSPLLSTTDNAMLYLLLTPSGGLAQNATGLYLDASLGLLNNVTDTGATLGDIPVVSDGSPLTYLAQPLQFNYDSTLHGGPATSHAVAHNLNQQFVNVSVYKQEGSPTVAYSQIIPQSVVLDSSTQLTVTFNTSLECLVVVMGVPGVGLA